MKTCFFIGHRDAPGSLYPALYAAVEEHIIRYGITEFLVGKYGAFDGLASRAVIAAKMRHPQVTLTRLLPYLSSRQEILPPGFDGFLYPEGLERIPKPYAIAKANRLAIAQATHVIAYVRYTVGNAQKMVDYAQKTGVAVTFL